MTSSPLVSVLMTVFNAEPYLAFSIASIRGQTFADWEFIIVDDASTDGSLAIAEAYAVKDSRIRVIRNSVNKGQTACLNQGLHEARGRWIARQDADDLSHPERLQKQLERVATEPTLALLGTCGIMIDDENHLMGLLDMPLTHELIVWSAPMNNPFLHTAVLFRTEVARGLGGYDEHYRIAQDYDLWTRIMHQHRVANLPERLVSYRHLESSLSKQGRSTTQQEFDAISRREEKNAFHRMLHDEERVVLASFREGGGNDSFFWKLYRQLQPKFKNGDPLLASDQARLEAIYYLKSAGSSDGHLLLIITKIKKAFFVAPRFTLTWLWKRMTHST